MGLLKELSAEYARSKQQSVSLLQTEMFAQACRVEDFAPAMEALSQARVPHPALSASYQWLLSSVSDPLPTTLIQGMRDYFGAHTYLRTDREGIFHTRWQDGSGTMDA
jgi:6-phosphogluconate dehydrogenase